MTSESAHAPSICAEGLVPKDGYTAGTLRGPSPVDVGGVCPSPELCDEVTCLCAMNTYQSTLGRYIHTEV